MKEAFIPLFCNNTALTQDMQPYDMQFQGGNNLVFPVLSTWKVHLTGFSFGEHKGRFSSLPGWPMSRLTNACYWYFKSCSANCAH